MKGKWMLSTALFFLCQCGFAQLDTIHWLPPMHPRLGSGDHYLYLSTPEITPFWVTIEDGRSRVMQRVQVSNTTPQRITLGNGINTRVLLDESFLNLVLFDRGLIIHGSKPFYANFRANSDDTFHATDLTCKGRVAAGTEFRTGHLYSVYGYDRCHFIGMMATEDGTTVNITNLRRGLTLWGPRGGDPRGTRNFVLNKGQSYVLATYSEPNNPANDEGFMGTSIKSSKPIVVNVGSWKGSPISGGRDIGIDQIVPIDVIGDEYILIRGSGTDEIELPIVVAAYDNTDVFINCETTPRRRLNAGQYAVFAARDYTPNGNIYIRATQPIYVYQHMGGLPSPVTSGLNFIPPLSCLIPKFVDNIPFINYIGDRKYNGFVTIVSQANHPVFVNTQRLDPYDSKAVACNSNYVTYRIPADEIFGEHATITSSGSIQVALQGGDQYAGWGAYFSGFARRPDAILQTGILRDQCPDSLVATGIFDEFVWLYNDSVFPTLKETVLPNPAPGRYRVIGYFSNCIDVQDTSAVVVVPKPDTVFVDKYSCSPQDTGVFMKNWTNRKGCDSMVFTTVNLLPNNAVELRRGSCNPQDTGTFVQILRNRFGCDSVVSTKVELLPEDLVQFVEGSCNPQDTGFFQYRLTNRFGCDSLVERRVRLLPFNLVRLFDASCNPRDTGTFSRRIRNQFGCDSIIVTHVALLPESTAQTTETTCNPAEVGVFFRHLSNQFGCDSTVEVTVNQLPRHWVDLRETSCAPQDTGTFVQVLTNIFGCDSIVTTEVELLQRHDIELFKTSCFPLDTGTFVQNLANRFGCDSTVTTYVALLPKSFNSVFESSCDPRDTGTFVQIVPNYVGCDSTVTRRVELLPKHATQLFQSSCNPQDTGTFVQILPNRFGCDSTVTTRVDLLPKHFTQLHRTTCNPRDSGIFTDVLPNRFGCDSTVTTTVDFIPLDTVRLPDESNCRNEPLTRWGKTYEEGGIFCETFVTQFGCDSTVCFALQFRDTSVFYQQKEICRGSSVYVGNSVYTNSGLYRDYFSNATGCDSLVLTELTVHENPRPQIIADPIYCLGDSVKLEMNDAFAQHRWLPGGEISQSIFSKTAGNFELEVWDANGCYAKTAYQLPPPLEVAGNISIETDFNGYQIRCHDGADGILSARASGGLPPYRFDWTQNRSGALLSNLPEGDYLLTVTDAAGCQWTGTAAIAEPPPLQLALDALPARCFGENNGQIQIRSAGGGVPNYRFGLNEKDTSLFVESEVFENLGAGIYTVSLLDANGCLQTARIEVKQPLPLTIQLGPDREIDLGDSVILAPRIGGVFETIGWEPPDFLTCPDCLAPISKPLTSMTYRATIQDLNGCTATDDIAVQVLVDYGVYIPSAFSPNEDGINDGFTIYATPNVEKIESLLVFSRWGELVFENYDFQPNLEQLGWDGYHRAEPMQSAVFAYFAVVRFIDGTVKFYEGDVTLVR